MKNDYIWMIGFVAILLLVVLVLQWPEEKQQQVAQQNSQQSQHGQQEEQRDAEAAEYSVYGISMSLESDNKRTITWLSPVSMEHSSLQIKRDDELWEQAVTIEAHKSSYTNQGGEQIYAYTVQAEHLQSSNSYQYRIAAGEQILSEEYTIQIANEDEDAFQFIHITDSQGIVENDYKQWGKTLQAATDAAPEAAFIVHGGDLTDDPAKEQQWKWFYQYAPSLATIPFLPTTGNHEQIDNDAAAFSVRFQMPDNGAEGSLDNTTYYALYHNLLFISLNTEGNIKGQTTWLKQVLSEHSEQYQWIVVSMHRGVYGASRFKDGKDWVKLFDEYNVDLVLQGHNHQYSRSYPLIDGDAVSGQEKGTLYVTLNASGTKFNDEKKAKTYQAIAFQNRQSMYAIVDVTQEQLTYSAYDVSGRLLDQFSIAEQ